MSHMDQHFKHSSYREKLIEHIFIGELLKISWRAGDCALEVAKPEVDNRGYDVILERNGIVRHVQLKTSQLTGAAARQTIHTALATKPSGCVVWIQFDPATLVLGPFLFFGGAPGNPLPPIENFKTARHTKANMSGVKADRVDHRVVRKSEFERIERIEDLFDSLLGARLAVSSELQNEVLAVEEKFHELILQRVSEFRLDFAGVLPKLRLPLFGKEKAIWFPVDGMYGGFSYWFSDSEGCVTLVSESWCRVLGGSGMRHQITSSGIELVEEGFV